jgi:hypothetical protein
MARRGDAIAFAVVVVAAASGCGSPSDPGSLGGGASGGGTMQTEDSGDPPAVPRDTVDAGNLAAPLPDGGPAPTWTAIYAAYFGPGSMGHCANMGCHDVVNNHFMCGTTQEDCYQGLVAGVLIDPSDPTSSRLTDPEMTPLSWYDTGGNMPFDMSFMPSAQASDDIAAWVYAGALDN